MVNKKNRLIITGANGLVGRRLVSLALEQGWSVTALARSTQWLESLGAPGLRVVPWDIHSDISNLDDVHDADALCHCAAFTPPNHDDPTHAEKCLQINALGTLELLKATSNAGIKRFVYCSGGQFYLPGTRLATEDDPLYPSHRATFYLASKLLGELYADHYRQSRNLPTTILRIASVYGPQMNKDSLIAKFVQLLRQGLPIEVHDGGRYTVDFVYVDDVARAALAAVKKNADGAFNIGSGAVTTTLELARQTARVLQASPDLIQVLPATQGDVPSGFAGLDISRAKTILGYAPTPLEDGLRHLVAAPNSK